MTLPTFAMGIAKVRLLSSTGFARPISAAAFVLAAGSSKIASGSGGSAKSDRSTTSPSRFAIKDSLSLILAKPIRMTVTRSRSVTFLMTSERHGVDDSVG